MFLNEVVNKICEILDTKNTYTTSYKPKCKGSVERVNQTFVGQLAKIVNQRWKEWDELLPIALYAYKISSRSAIKASPFEFLYGRKPNPITQKQMRCEEKCNELVIERLNTLRDWILKEERLKEKKKLHLLKIIRK